MGIRMSVKLGIAHEFRNGDHDVATNYWDGLYAVTNVEEVDWRHIDNLIENIGTQGKGLQLHIRFNVDVCGNQKEPP